MEINDIIKSKLESIGESFDSLKPFMQEYLVKIETIISEKTTIQANSLKLLKSNSFSVSSISKELGCSRTTLYNHGQLLKVYIEHSEMLFNQDNPFVAYEELKDSKGKLQEQISLMEDRDITTEILKQEKSELSIMLKEKNKEIERLQVRVNELSSEVRQIKISSTNPSRSKVVSSDKN